jgi:hypothetical protein
MAFLEILFELLELSFLVEDVAGIVSLPQKSGQVS